MQGLFLKAVASVYFFAFLSLHREVLGLFGSQGIASIAHYLHNAERVFGRSGRFRNIPTLFWWNASDSALRAAAWSGMLLSCAALMGIYPSVCLMGLSILYYSFFCVGSPFLHYQWDTLLLETGFTALLIGIQKPAPNLLIYLAWFLLFRLLFSSGIAKWMYGSREWKDGTAMEYHYETQPLPTVLGYYIHHLPKFWSKASVVVVYLMEILCPLLIFTSGDVRWFVFWGQAGFQIAILLTGNFAFFNYLTIALCIPLLQDTYLTPFKTLSNFAPLFHANTSVAILLSLIGGFFILSHLIELGTLFVNMGKWNLLTAPFKKYGLLNPYGLFVHMTTIRHEIILEGSLDAQEWRAYEFKWKPGRLTKRPSWIAPLQPRLDWQMWFAALSPLQTNHWFNTFLIRLLEGAPDVVSLLETNPFPDNGPRYIRAVIYRYQFTDLKSRKQTGAWWQRQKIGIYEPN